MKIRDLRDSHTDYLMISNLPVTGASKDNTEPYSIPISEEVAVTGLPFDNDTEGLTLPLEKVKSHITIQVTICSYNDNQINIEEEKKLKLTTRIFSELEKERNKTLEKRIADADYEELYEE